MRTQASVITVKVRISPPIGRLTRCALVAARRAVITLCRAAKINYKLRVPQGHVKVAKRKTETERREKKRYYCARERKTLCICICARIGNIVASRRRHCGIFTERRGLRASPQHSYSSHSVSCNVSL